jgi:hypothetical protein
MKEQLKEFEFLWLFLVLIFRQFMQWIGVGAGICVSGVFVWMALSGIGFLVSKLFDLDADNEAYVRLLPLASMCLAGSLWWKIEGVGKQGEIDLCRKGRTDAEKQIVRLQQEIGQYQKDLTDAEKQNDRLKRRIDKLES